MIAITKFYLLIFALITLALAVKGYTAGSKASLIAGGVSGALLLLGAILVFTGQVKAGLIVGLVVSFLLLGRFGMVWAKEGAFYPSGLISLLSVAGFVLSLLSLFRK